MSSQPKRALFSVLTRWRRRTA